MSQLSGSPKTVLDVQDKSIIKDTPIAGIQLVQGITKRGLRNVPHFIGSPLQFRRKLGGKHASDPFAQYCLRMLEGGVKLWVIRAFNYTSITDPDTVTGTKASVTIQPALDGAVFTAEEVGDGYNGSLVAVTAAKSGIVEVLATGTVTLDSGASGSVDGITVNGVEIMSGAETFVDTLDNLATAVAANITANTSAPNYTAVAVGPIVTITAVSGSGASPNAFAVISTTTTIVTTDVNMSGGITGEFDLAVTLTDSDVTIEVLSVTKNPDAPGIIAINKRLLEASAGVELTSIVGGGFDAGTGLMTLGVQSTAAILAADFTGDVAGTGWFVGDSVVDAFRAIQIGLEDPEVDEGLRAYIVARGDMKYGIPTPLGLNASGFEDYRDGTGAYTHIKHDTFLGTLVAGDISITDVELEQDSDIPGLVDYAILQARKDVDFGPWFSAAGPKRGATPMPNNGVPYNLASASLATDFDRIYNKGVNAVIKDADYGVVYWGNKSLLIDPTKLTNKENVADLVVHLIRTLRPLVRATMFDPNDPIMWKELFRSVSPTLYQLESARAFVPGEDVNWFWQGDQNADRREDAIFNTQANLDAGKYSARFVFIPIAATEFIGIELVPTDSNSVKFVVIENPLT